MTYRYPRSACAGFVDGSLIAFKKYVDVYWDLVPPPTVFSGHSLLDGSSPHLVFGSEGIIRDLLAGSLDPGAYWAALTILKKRAFVPQKRMWGQLATKPRAMTRVEFWDVLRERLIGLALCDKNIWTPRT